MDDLVAIKSIESPELSPDGSMVAYVLGTINLKENRTDKDVYVVSLGEEPRKLTESGARVRSRLLYPLAVSATCGANGAAAPSHCGWRLS